MVLPQPENEMIFPLSVRWGGCECQKPGEPVSGRGGAEERFPLLRRAQHCTGNCTRQQSTAELLSSTRRTQPCPHSAACATPPAHALLARNPSPKPTPCPWQRWVHGLGALTPSPGHRACDKDLGLTLGSFICSNLFAAVCRAASQDGISPSTLSPSRGGCQPQLLQGHREGFISIRTLG